MKGSALLAAMVLCATAHSSSSPSPPRKSYFPLEVGRYWVYRGPTRWTGNDLRVNSAEITWRMEVVDAARRGIVRAALLKGHPSDLARYKPGGQPGDYLIIQIGAGQYHLLKGDDAVRVFETLRTPGADRRELFEGTTIWKALATARDTNPNVPGISDQSLYLDTPLVEGKVYGEFDKLAWARYCYAVTARHPFSGRTVKGLRSSMRSDSYEIRFRTSPDHSITEFVPGVGIVAYTYVHHGTIAETHLRLVETGVRKDAAVLWRR